MIDPAILVVIVNYRTAALAIDALRSIAPDMGRQRRAIVVDNASGDGSAGRIADAITADFGDWCSLLALGDNRGFGAGNNAAVAKASAEGFTPDLIWLLNPDTRALPGAIERLAAFMAAHAEAAIVGTRIEEPDGSPQFSAFRFPTPLGELDAALGVAAITRRLRKRVIAPPISDRAQRTDWVSGASMMIRGALFDRLGGFDEDYFLYYEETDLCRRAADLGAECWYEPAARVVHLVGQSTGITAGPKAPARRPRYWFASRALYYRRHLGRIALVVATLAWLIAWPLGRIFARIRGRLRPETPGLWLDMLRFGNR